MARSLGIIPVSGSVSSIEDAASLRMTNSRSLLLSGRDSYISESIAQRGDIIAVIGPAGSGKSSFIKWATGLETILIGHCLDPCTTTVQSFGCRHPLEHNNSRNVVFVDTPGYDDARSRDDILQSIAAWLDETYGNNVTLTGLLLFHPITANRLTLPRKSSALRRLCGAECFKNVTVITTMWSEFNAELGIACETKLQDELNSKIKDRLRLSRFEYTHKSAWMIVDQCITSDSLPSQADITSYPKREPVTVNVPWNRNIPNFKSKRQNDPSCNSQESLRPRLLPQPRRIEGPRSRRDTIIAVMGPTGSGKSSFIKCATGLETIAIHHGLDPNTKRVQSFKCRHPRDNNCSIVFVDTPGDDINNNSKDDILNSIAAWIDKAYGKNSKATLTGLLLFHQMTTKRVAETPPMNSGTLQRLCGTEALTKMTAITTMWSRVNAELGAAREIELRNKWKPMIEEGLRLTRFEYTHESAWMIVDQCITGESLSAQVKTATIESVKTEDLSDEQVIIAVVGPTGSGKSSFIGKLTGNEAVIGHDLQSSTTDINAVKLTLLDKSDHDIVLVDTPSFDDTYRSDTKTLEAVANWLMETYKRKITLAGILYFHRISDNRVGGTSNKIIHMFQDLCGECALENVVLVTTMWDEVDEETGRKREKELRREFWKNMIDQGSVTARYTGTAESAWKIVDHFVGTANRRHSLQLQKEMVDMKKKLNETKAGEELYTRLEVLVYKHQAILQKIRAETVQGTNKDVLQAMEAEYEGLRGRIATIVKEMQTMKLPLGQRLLRMIRSPLGFGMRE